MYDCEIRSAFHQKILSKAHLDDDTLVINELGIKNGSFRADIAVLNGRMEGYEIKGEHDTLVRLPDQVFAYNAIFERASLITCEKFLDSCIEIVPNWWGIYVAKPARTEGIRFKKIQTATLNKSRDAYSLVRLLWKDEAVDLALRFCSGRQLQKERRHDVYRILVEHLTLNEITSAVLKKLKKRTSWRQDPLPLS